MRVLRFGPFALVALVAQGVARAAPPDTELAPAGSATPAPPPPPTASAAQPAPYAAWQGTNYAPPTTPPPGTPPAPVASEPAFARRPVELIPRLGVAFPSCKAGTLSDDRCQGVATGGFGGFSAFWRVTPHFAWGGGFEVASFTYTAPPQLALTNTHAAAVFLGLAGRVYFNEEGSLDPFLQLGLGVSALGTSGDDTTGTTWDETGAGPAVQIGGGVDFYLSRSLRLGPTLMYTRVFVDKLRRCNGGGSGSCVDLPKDEDGHLNAYLTVGAALTIMLGEEL